MTIVGPDRCADKQKLLHLTNRKIHIIATECMVSYLQKAIILHCLYLALPSKHASDSVLLQVIALCAVLAPCASSCWCWHSTMKLPNGSAGQRTILNTIQFRTLWWLSLTALWTQPTQDWSRPKSLWAVCSLYHHRYSLMQSLGFSRTCLPGVFSPTLARLSVS